MAEEVDAGLPLQEEVVRRLDLITNTPGAVLKYDTDGDGVLDEQEWEVLRSIVEAGTRHARLPAPAGPTDHPS